MIRRMNDKMIKIDLITGFLGAGKTTFIRKYAKYLMDSGKDVYKRQGQQCSRCTEL